MSIKFYTQVSVNDIVYKLVFVDGVPSPKDMEESKKHDYLICLCPQEVEQQDLMTMHNSGMSKYSIQKLLQLMHVMCNDYVVDGDVKVEDDTIEEIKLKKMPGTHNLDRPKFKWVDVGGLYKDKVFNFRSAVFYVMNSNQYGIQNQILKWNSIPTESLTLNSFIKRDENAEKEKES